MRRTTTDHMARFIPIIDTKDTTTLQIVVLFASVNTDIFLRVW